MNRRILYVMAVLTACALGVTGCSKSASTAHRPTIVYIPQSLGNGYFQPISDGFKQQAAALGFDYQEVGPSDSSANSQLSFIQSAIQDHVSAIAISPNDATSVVPDLQRAIAAGIKVISVNSPVGAGGANATINPTDFSKVGPLLSKLQTELQDGKGNFAILSAAQNAVGQNQWIADLKTTMSGDSATYGNMKLVSTQYGDDQADKSATVMQGLLTQYGCDGSAKSLQGVLSPTAAGLPAAAKVLDQSKCKGKIALTGLALPNSMKPFIADGTVTKFALWDPKVEGLVGAQLLMDMINKKVQGNSNGIFAGVTVTSNGKTWTTDTTGTLNAGELITFDKSNIDQYNF